MLHKLRVVSTHKDFLIEKIKTKIKTCKEKGLTYQQYYDPLYTRLKYCLLDICILTEERYYCLFTEKGYKVLDKLKHHSTVYQSRNITGNDAKKWAYVENKKFFNQLASMPDKYMYVFN